MFIVYFSFAQIFLELILGNFTEKCVTEELRYVILGPGKLHTQILCGYTITIFC